MILSNSLPSSPVNRMARFSQAPPGTNYREPQAGPTDSVTLSSTSPAAERPARLGTTGWRVGLFLGLSMLGLAGAAHAGPPAQKPQTQSQPVSQAQQAGRKVNETVVRPAVETGKEIGKVGKQVGQEIGQAGKEFGLGVKDQAVKVGHGFRDFFKGVAGK